ncbi:DUF945 family protein [Photobacterium angustum]|uniref:DUF945 domain-containing protein n=1 Tax=Photobacterium angustum TaxID=661 RepID=A0A2S7VJA0_PHOAN|nr:DUF945 family protein [Photobacterium angustum]PQJ62243.1 hypothetical protein BTO08_18550 [Photobacterium angustum]
MNKSKATLALIIAAIGGCAGAYYVTSQKVATAYEKATNFLPTEFDGITIISKKTDFGMLGGEAFTKYRINMNQFLGDDAGFHDEPLFLIASTEVNSTNPLKVTTDTSFAVSGEAGQEISDELLNSGIKFTHDGKPYSITNEHNQFILPMVLKSENEDIIVKTADMSKSGEFYMAPIIFKYTLKNNHESVDISLKYLDFFSRKDKVTLSDLSIVSNDNINPESTSSADRYLNGKSSITLGKLVIIDRNDGVTFKNASLNTNYQVNHDLLNLDTALKVGEAKFPKNMQRDGIPHANNLQIKAILDGIDYRSWNSITEKLSDPATINQNQSFDRWFENLYVNLGDTNIKELSLSSDLAQGNVEGKLSAKLDDSVSRIKMKELDRVMQNSLILDFRGSLPITLATEIFSKYDLQNLINKNALTRKGERLESHIKYEDGMPQFMSNQG